MTTFRRFLLRGGMLGRISLLAAFAILFARALLPGAVMLDPQTAAQGDFALVMCSGHGPMFGHDANSMSHMSGGPQDHVAMPDMSDHPAHNSMTGDDGLCPFSAALFVACVDVALAIVLFALTRATPSWTAMTARLLPRPSHYSRPLSRGPPVFS